MDLIKKLETEWSKNFPGDPLPSNIPREKSYNYHSLQNTIRKCEQTIENLNKKLQQEIFLKDFLQNFTEKLSDTNEKKRDFITLRKTSAPTIGNLVTETVSTMVLHEHKITSIEETSTNLQTQSENNNVDGEISKTTGRRVSFGDGSEKLHGDSSENPIQVKQENSTWKVKSDEKILLTTGTNNQQEHLKNRPVSFVSRRASDLNPRRNQQSNSVYVHKTHTTNTLQPTLSLRKNVPPSLPPKPKKKPPSNVTSDKTDTKTNNNDGNYQHCSDAIKTNISEKANLNAAADPYAELGGQSPSNCFSIEVGKCSGFCADDIKAGLVESGAKSVKSSVKQVAAASQPFPKQQRDLTSTTTETDSLTTVLVTEILTNLVVKATSNSDDNINKQNTCSNDVTDYRCGDDTSQLTVEDKESLHPLSTPPLSTEQQGISGVSEQKILLDVAGQENIKPSKPPFVPSKKSIQSNSFENSSLLQQQTRRDQPSQKETECPESTDTNREVKGNVRNSRVSLMRKEVIIRKDRGNVNEEKDAVITNIKTLESTTSGSNNNTNDTTDMSTFKKQREDICFVSYRKLDTEFYESSFTNTSTLPIPKRRSSLLKADDTISENLSRDTVFAEKPNVPSRNSTFKIVGNKDDPRKNVQENYSLQFDNKSKSVDSGFSIDSSSLTDTENVSVVKQEHSSSPLGVKKNVDNTENTGICQTADQKLIENSCIEIKKTDSGEYKTCIELTDDEESDSSEKKMVKNANSGTHQSFSNSEDDTDEEIISSIYENEEFDSLEDINLLKMRKQAVRQFLATEEIFVENLENIQKLMDQFGATIESKESLLSKTDFEVIFFKISEILSLHQTCVKQLAPKIQNWQNNETVGNILKELMVNFPTFEEYTKNYPVAAETIKRCSQLNGVFKKIAEEASFNPDQQKSSLTVLLYKPISQLQFNTSFIKELLQYTPKNHADYKTIASTWELTQYNLTGITNSVEDKAESDRYLLKSDYLVELVGNVRKLRCFFLFNDVLVCTKQKFWQKGSFDVKWFIPICQLLLDTNFDNDETKYHSTETIDDIKRKISCLETDLRKENDKDRLSVRAKEKLKKKLSELQRELARLSGYLEFNLKHNKKTYTLLMSTDYAREEWKEAVCGLKEKCVSDMNFTASEVQQLISNCKKLPNISTLSPHQQTDKIEEHGFIGSLIVTLHELTGLDEICTTYCCLELDSCGQFFTKARSVPCNEAHPVWNEEFELELDYSHTLRILCYKKRKDNQGDILLGKSALALSKDWLSNFTRKTISMNTISLVISITHLPANKTIQRIPSKVKTGTFGVNIQKVAHHQNRPFPALISLCTQEIEKRGLHEIGIYRVSGGQSDVKRLKHAFEKSTIRARKIIADPDFNIHAVAAVLKLFFRELPEPLFTNASHNKFLSINDIYDREAKKKKVITLIHSLPDVNYHTLIHLLHHLQRISENSAVNKMTNSNLAVIFGQSLMQPAPSTDQNSVEMTSFLNAHLQNDVLEYIMHLQCDGVNLATR